MGAQCSCSTGVTANAVDYNVQLSRRQPSRRKSKSRRSRSRSQRFSLIEHFKSKSYDSTKNKRKSETRQTDKSRSRGLSYNRMSSLNLFKFNMQLAGTANIFDLQRDAISQLDEWQTSYGIGPFSGVSCRILFHNRTRNYIHFESDYSNLGLNGQVFNKCFENMGETIPPSNYWCLFCHRSDFAMDFENLKHCVGYVCFSIGNERPYGSSSHYLSCAWNKSIGNDNKIKCALSKNKGKIWQNRLLIDRKNSMKTSGYGFRLEAKYMSDNNLYYFKLS